MNLDLWTVTVYVMYDSGLYQLVSQPHKVFKSVLDNGTQGWYLNHELQLLIVCVVNKI